MDYLEDEAFTNEPVI